MCFLRSKYVQLNLLKPRPENDPCYLLLKCSYKNDVLTRSNPDDVHECRMYVGPPELKRSCCHFFTFRNLIGAVTRKRHLYKTESCMRKFLEPLWSRVGTSFFVFFVPLLFFVLFFQHAGFVGCVRDLTVNRNKLDPRVLLSTAQVREVSLDNCQLVDPCLRPNACEHGGQCNVDEGRVVCDCTGTGYTGKNCHFGMHSFFYS